MISKINDYLGLIVPEYIPMAITSALLGAVLSKGGLPGYEFLIVIPVLTFIVAAFNSFNAIADKEIDKINKLHRPLPAKKLMDWHALWFAIVLYALALVLAFTVNTAFFIIILSSVLITAAYSYPGIDLKRKFIVGNFAVTGFYAILCTLSGWALYPDTLMPLPMIFFLFLMGFSLSVSKDFMDVPGDLAHGANTFPVRIGKMQSISIIFAILSFSFMMLLLLISQKYVSEKFYALLIFFPLLAFNVNRFGHANSNYDGNTIFQHIIILISLLQITIIGLQLWSE